MTRCHGSIQPAIIHATTSVISWRILCFSSHLFSFGWHICCLPHCFVDCYSATSLLGRGPFWISGQALSSLYQGPPAPSSILHHQRCCCCSVVPLVLLTWSPWLLEMFRSDAMKRRCCSSDVSSCIASLWAPPVLDMSISAGIQRHCFCFIVHLVLLIGHHCYLICLLVPLRNDTAVARLSP